MAGTKSAMRMGDTGTLAPNPIPLPFLTSSQAGNIISNKQLTSPSPHLGGNFIWWAITLFRYPHANTAHTQICVLHVTVINNMSALYLYTGLEISTSQLTNVSINASGREQIVHHSPGLARVIFTFG